MKNLEMNKAIETVANQMDRSILVEAEMGMMDVKRFNTLLDFKIRKYSFENQTAKDIFKTLVTKEISKEAYSLVFPELGADAYGNYTTDKTKWV